MDKRGGAPALIDELTEFAAQPHFVYRHRWEPDDVVMWDNRCTMHQVTPLDPRERRVMHRTTIVGTEPVMAALSRHVAKARRWSIEHPAPEPRLAGPAARGHHRARPADHRPAPSSLGPRRAAATSSTSCWPTPAPATTSSRPCSCSAAGPIAPPGRRSCARSARPSSSPRVADEAERRERATRACAGDRRLRGSAARRSRWTRCWRRISRPPAGGSAAFAMCTARHPDLLASIADAAAARADGRCRFPRGLRAPGASTA